MSLRVRLSKDAQEHLDNALRWYSANAPQQVERILAEISAVRSRIGDFPYLGRRTDNGMRVTPMKVFPYNYWYVIENDGVVVVAVTHMRRDTSSVLRGLSRHGSRPHKNRSSHQSHDIHPGPG